MKKRVSVFRREHFNSAHRLYSSQWTDEQNSDVFGKCSLPNYHGHNYELDIQVVGEVDDETGFVMDMKKLSEITDKHVLQRFDHKNLNLDTVEFKNLNPTAENIVIVIYDLLRPHIPAEMDLYLRLYETPKNFVEYPVK
jgi:6-pyruvoyltetrahydropterin/6-carboxytetrahydropterin synthase